MVTPVIRSRIVVGSRLVRAMPGALLIPELEDVIQHASSARRAETLRRITALFVEGQADLTAIMSNCSRSIHSIDARGRYHRAYGAVAPAGAGPECTAAQYCAASPRTMTLQWHDLFSSSRRLTESDLVEIVQTRSQAHLLAVSKRKRWQSG